MGFALCHRKDASLRKKKSFFFTILVELVPTLWAFNVFGFPVAAFIFLLISQPPPFL